MSVTRENRQHPRMAITWPVEIESAAGVIKGKTSNISVGGALILCKQNPEIEDKCPIVIKPSDSQPISVNFAKAWEGQFDIDGSVLYALGIRFIDLTDDDREWIAAQIVVC